jgi:small subunit ribosomal protein S8
MALRGEIPGVMKSSW